MINLELNDAQVSELASLLERILGDLSYEISDTDTHDFREQLKARRDVLHSIADMLDPAAT